MGHHLAENQSPAEMSGAMVTVQKASTTICSRSMVAPKSSLGVVRFGLRSACRQRHLPHTRRIELPIMAMWAIARKRVHSGRTDCSL
jgi:hypothetical protein